MSRIGKQPVVIPDGVKASVQDGYVCVEGKMGLLRYPILEGLDVEVRDGEIVVKRTGTTKQSLMNWGTMRSIIANMVVGVSQGWKKSLELSGVGYGAELVGGDKIKLVVGLSHEVEVKVPEGVSAKVSKTNIELVSPDKQKVGNFAAKLMSVRPPEPYLGKGIRIVGKPVRRKAGKTGK